MITATPLMDLARSVASSPARGYPELLVAVVCFFFFFIFRRWNRDTNIPLNWPLVGMLPGLLSQLHRLHDFATDLLGETGCTFMFKGPWFSGMDLVVTCDPANVNHIFNTNFPNYPKGEDYSEIFDILGDGIFNADWDSWKSQRRTAQFLMTDPRFRRFVAETSRDKVEKGLLPLFEHLAAARPAPAVDLQDVFLRFTFDTTCNLVLGVDPGCLSVGLPTVPFAKAMDDAEEVLLSRHTMPKSWWKLMRWLRVGEEKRMAAAWETIDHFLADHISKRMEEVCKARQDKEGQPEDTPAAADLLTSYLHLRPEVGDSAKFLRDTIMNFLLAGRDTTGAALTWFFWLVSKNPGVEEKILEELRARLRVNSKGSGQHEHHPVVFDAGEELSTAVYLHAALCEALRLFPPVPFEHKGAVRADVLPSGEKVDPKAKILFSLYSMGRMVGVWGEDCLEFKPERWISGKGGLRHEPSYKFLSFNSGPRTCLGKDMAFTQMKVVAATLLYNFHVRVLEGHVVAPKISIMLHMKNGLMVRVEKRSHAAS